MKYYIDEFLVEYSSDKNQLFESVLLLFASGKEFKESNEVLSKLGYNNEQGIPYYGIRVTRITNGIISNDRFYVGNDLDGGLNGNWVTVDLKELINNAESMEVDNPRILSFIQNNLDQEASLTETLESNFEINTSHDVSDEFTVALGTPLNTIITNFGNLGTKCPSVTLLFAGFGNATRISYLNRDVYYDYGTRYKNGPIGAVNNTVRKNSIFIISHWDFDHYSALLNKNISSNDVAMIIGKNIFPNTQSLFDLQKKFASQLKYISFSSKKGGPMSLKYLAQINNITMFETGPGQTKNRKNSNKAEIILRIKQFTYNVYLTGDSMWKQILLTTDQHGATFFDSKHPLQKDMLVIPHHGGNAGSFSNKGIYQRVLTQSPNVKFAISVDPYSYFNKNTATPIIPNKQTSIFFKKKHVKSTMPIPNWNASKKIQDVQL